MAKHPTIKIMAYWLALFTLFSLSFIPDAAAKKGVFLVHPIQGPVSQKIRVDIEKHIQKSIVQNLRQKGYKLAQKKSRKGKRKSVNCLPSIEAPLPKMAGHCEVEMAKQMSASHVLVMTLSPVDSGYKMHAALYDVQTGVPLREKRFSAKDKSDLVKRGQQLLNQMIQHGLPLIEKPKSIYPRFMAGGCIGFSASCPFIAYVQEYESTFISFGAAITYLAGNYYARLYPLGPWLRLNVNAGVTAAVYVLPIVFHAGVGYEFSGKKSKFGIDASVFMYFDAYEPRAMLSLYYLEQE